uniref:(northern house mosquito) hypothetical protein n=1 Tax=Culex pipiens TaxID=7175 RepID=A0A8D8G5X2_CULPI
MGSVATLRLCPQTASSSSSSWPSKFAAHFLVMVAVSSFQVDDVPRRSAPVPGNALAPFPHQDVLLDDHTRFEATLADALLTHRVEVGPISWNRQRVDRVEDGRIAGCR